MKRLDATQLTIHTDEVIAETVLHKGCCPPEPILVKDEKKSYIITASTECLKRGYYYTLTIDRETPFEAAPLDTYINVVPCGFHDRGEIGLNFSKTVHRKHFSGDVIGGEGNTLESPEIDGGAFDGEVGHLVDEQYDGGRFGCAGLIPSDPAFPGMDFVGSGYRSKEGVLIPLTLDIHGSICTGKNLSTGRFKPPGTGGPYSNRFVLFLNNAGTFVLSRNWRRRSDYA